MSNRYDSWAKATRTQVYFDNYNQIIDKILNESDVLVACLPHDQGVIIGFMVYNKAEELIHYIYVKESFRRNPELPYDSNFHVASSLYLQVFERNQNIICSHRTKTSDVIYRTHQNLIYNPYVLFTKE